AMPASSTTSTASASTFSTFRTITFSSLLRGDDVVFEVTGAVGLRPQPHSAVDGRLDHGVVLREQIGVRRRPVSSRLGRGAEHVGEHLRAVERAGDVCAVDVEPQLVKLLSIAFCLQEVAVARPDERTADAVVELPEDDVVLGVVVAEREPVAVLLDVEE